MAFSWALAAWTTTPAPAGLLCDLVHVSPVPVFLVLVVPVLRGNPFPFLRGKPVPRVPLSA